MQRRTALASYPAQRRSYNVIYGSGVNYGNIDLPFTSHQADNWPVSCCYDRRRGQGRCHACFHVPIANRSRFVSDAAFDSCTGVQNLAFFLWGGEWKLKNLNVCLRVAPALVWQNAIKGGIAHFFFPAECHDNTISEIFMFFLFLKKKDHPHPPHLCLHFQFAYQRNPIGTCFAYLHLISNFKWTCQKWSSFLFWMCEDYLACIISASTCNRAKKNPKTSWFQTTRRGTFYSAFH